MKFLTSIGMLLAVFGTSALTPATAATATLQPTEAEQYLLQVLNRARANGTTEMVRLGNAGNVNEGSPKVGPDSWTNQNTVPPLAWNTALASAAQSHANNLQSADWYFKGSTYGGNPHSPNSLFPAGASISSGRISAAGFSNTYSGCRVSSPNGYAPGPECITFYLSSPSNGWSNAETLALMNTAHEGLFEDFSVAGRGHRNSMMYEWHNEVGFGTALATDLQSPSTLWDSIYLVQNFGQSSTSSNSFITGMVYTDLDNNQFYTPYNGEPIAGLTVQARQAGNIIDSTAAFETGGYSLRLAAGTYEIRFVKANGTYHSAGNVVLGSSNVELNVRNPLFIASFASWIGGYPAATSASEFNQDADKDGLENGVEHVLGSDPTTQGAGLYQTSSTGTILKFRHSQTNSMVAEVSSAYLWSTDLTNWYASGITNPGGTRATISAATIVNLTAPQNDVIEVTVTITAGSAKKIYCRLSASKS